MYLNLKAEMARNGFSREAIAEACGMSPYAVDAWIVRDAEIKFSSAKAIRDALFPDLELDYLFEYTKSEPER